MFGEHPEPHVPKPQPQLKEIMKLYPEDYVKTHMWESVCDVVGMPYDSECIVLEFVRYGESEETLQEVTQNTRRKD